MRTIEKYIGTYRVLCERDVDGEVTDKDFNYLVGTGGYKTSKIYRQGEKTLKLYIRNKSVNPTKRILKIFDENDIEVIGYTDYESEVDVIFKESDIHKVAEIIKAKTSGANFPPTSIKNHPRYKEIKKERFESLSEDEKEKRRARGMELSKHLKSNA